MKSRREFVKRCCLLGSAGAAMHLTRLGLMTASAQTTSNYKALVCIYLAGGNDCNNTVIPLAPADYQAYSTARSILALPSTSLLPIPVSGGARSYGLHPKLVGVQKLYNQSKAALVFNVGTLITPTKQSDYQQNLVPVPRMLFSHSDQTAQWQTTNVTATGDTGWGEGWGARVIDRVQAMNSTSFPPGISVTGANNFLSGSQVPSVNVTPGLRFGLTSFGSPSTDRARQLAMQQILTFDTGVSLIGTASQITKTSLKTAQDLNAALNGVAPLSTPFPSNSLGQQLKQVASLIQVRAALGMNRQIFFCTQGGFDNHTDLLTSHESLMAALDPALSAFYAATQELGVDQSVTTFTETEFGRTLQPNTTQGSDHAWGGHQIVIGGGVHGGEAYGTYPTLALGGPDDTANRGSWIPTTALDQYTATLASWFGVGSGDLQTVFPNLQNFASKTLAFL